MKPYMDWSRVRFGLIVGVIYALLLNGIGYAAGLQGIAFPGKGLGLIIALSFYFAMGWWTAREAQSHNEGISQGFSMGLGIAGGTLLITLPLAVYLLGRTLPWPIFLVAALFGELKWAAVAFLGGRVRADRNVRAR